MTRGSPPDEAPVNPAPPPLPPPTTTTTSPTTTMNDTAMQEQESTTPIINPIPNTSTASPQQPNLAGVSDWNSLVNSKLRMNKTSADNGDEPNLTSAPPASPSQSPPPSLPDEENNGDTSQGSVDAIVDDGSDTDNDSPTFPMEQLQTLEEQLGRARWVVPVLPNQELQVCIDAAIRLCKKNMESGNEGFQRFVGNALGVSFTRVMTDEAVKEWKHEILRHIYKIAERAVELCVLKLKDDSLPLLEILALVFNPKNRYYGMTQQRDPDSAGEIYGEAIQDRVEFAAVPQSGPPRGFLIDLLNKFGNLGGFQKILERIQSETNLTCGIICALLKPFGLAYEYLTTVTVQTYFQEPIRIAHRYIQQMSDDELKKETRGDARETNPMELVRYLRNLATRLDGQENFVRELELMRLKIILRILQTSSFAGKMNALNEISKILQSVTSTPAAYNQSSSDEYLNVQQVVAWIRDNELLSVAIKENLHIIQYVEKLEKILRFMIKEKTLTINDLDQLWAAQAGKHDAIVKNVHDLLAKVAWDFTAEQLDHLFGCFQNSWNDAPKKQREKLLELIRRLAEDDRDGRCADKVLQLLWNFARNSHVPTDIMDQALQCHAKILDYSCTSQKEQHKIVWLEKCIDEIRQDAWVLPAMKHFRDICVQFPEGAANSYPQWPQTGGGTTSTTTTLLYRGRVIGGLQTAQSLVALISTSLVRYMESVRSLAKEREEQQQRMNNDDNNGESTSTTTAPTTVSSVDGRDHATQVQERLSFLKFVLRDGHLWLCDQQAKEIWDTLVVNPIFQVDREAGFKWFVKMMGDMADLDPEIQKTFFEQRVLQLDTSVLSESGMKCFERFFKHVNLLENHLLQNDRHQLHINDFDLIGQEYLWRVILTSNEDIANRAIDLVREVYTNPSADMFESGKLNQLHTEFIQSCINRLKAAYDTLGVLRRDKDSSNLVLQETVRMTRVLRVLYGYIVAYDEQCTEERQHVPLYRASLGRTIDIYVTFPSTNTNIGSTQGNNKQTTVSYGPVDFYTHSHQTLGGLKRQILQKLRLPGTNGLDGVGVARTRIDLSMNGGDILDSADDRKTLDELNFYGRAELQGKLHHSGGGAGASGGGGSSPGSSSGESSPGISPSLNQMGNGECENLLPSTWLCQKHDLMDFLLRIADLGSELKMAQLRDWSRMVLRAIPADVAIMAKIASMTEQGSPVAGASTSTTAPAPTPTTNLPAAISTANNNLQNVFFASSPSEVLYSLELIHAMLVPSRDSDSSRTQQLQSNFVKAGGIQVCLSTLLQNNFLAQTDSVTKATAFSHVLRLLRVLLSVAIHIRCTNDRTLLISGQLANPTDMRDRKQLYDYMTQFFVAMPSQLDRMMNQLCVGWTNRLDGMSVIPEQNYPEIEHARMIIKLAWAAASGNPSMYAVANAEEIHQAYLKKKEITFEMQTLSREALEVFILSVILNPNIMDALMKEKFLQQCIIDLVFSPYEYIRMPTGEFFYFLATKSFVLQPRNLHFLLTLLCTAPVLFTATNQSSRFCREYFILLRGLLVFANNAHVSFQQVEGLLDKEIVWLKDAQKYSVTHMEPYPDEALLEGHLWITRALVMFLPAEKKYLIGSQPGGAGLVKQLLEDFLLPSSRMFVKQKSQTIQRSTTIMGTMSESTPAIPARDNNTSGGGPTMPRSMTTIYSPSRCVPVCGSSFTVNAAYDLIIGLCTNCVQNMETIVTLLSEMYFDDSQFAVTDWEYAPPLNLRNSSVFVGLKNGGATCYMNSVFQQLFMIESLRNSILTAGLPTYAVDDSDGEDQQIQGPVIRPSPPPVESVTSAETSSTTTGTGTSTSATTSTTDVAKTSQSAEKTAAAEARKEYNMGVLQCVQLIFANLLGSQMQLYVPRKFWKQFRFGNELINVREQHDALEFFNSLVDSMDEALKVSGETKVCDKVFGGTFADQKICKGCPHRYTREETFTTLSLDVRNHHTLVDSLQEYVKGDLLESENAYLCEKCNRKVNAIKRLCIKKLPTVLAIQLKRFDFDWEREQAVKFNDYFEFPREIDMEPYTVDGLAKLDGEVLTDPDNNNEGDTTEKAKETPQAQTPPEKVSTHYKLRGIIVHSGQASGGHYYSFILQRLPNGQQKWYKFDDGDVSECRMEDDEEMRTQCFGGEYTSEAFDQYSRRLQQRRHKRWWNAYILFYERTDATRMTTLTKNFESMTMSGRACQMPVQLEDIVNRKNMKCCHRRNQYTVEFFNFVRSLSTCHTLLARSGQVPLQDHNLQMLLLLSTKLVSKFLFTTGLRAKRTLRGNPQDWTDVLMWLFSFCPIGRIWFANEILFKNMDNFAEYLLECPSPDVRLIFARILAYLAKTTIHEPLTSVRAPDKLCHPQDTLSDVIVRSVLMLLQKEVTDYGRHLKEYFGFFYFYACQGADEKRQLIAFNVPALFVRLVLDEGPGPALKYIAAEMQKLYATVSLLIRSCDVSQLCKSADEGPISPNPWQEPVTNASPLIPIQTEVVERLFETPPKFLKKLTEDALQAEETMKMIKFLSWENMAFTKIIFDGLSKMVRFGFNASDIRPGTDCWLQLLLLDDSWAEKRILMTVGGYEEQEGLFHYVSVQFNNNSRRCYLLVKMLSNLFEQSPTAMEVLRNNAELRRQWAEIVGWLNQEINGRPGSAYTGGSYGYNNWATPVQSNEVGPGTILERTKSAKLTLTKAASIVQSLPKVEKEESGGARSEDEGTDVGSNPGDTEVLGSSAGVEVPSHPPPPYSPGGGGGGSSSMDVGPPSRENEDEREKY